jgi:hypothetical protein
VLVDLRYISVNLLVTIEVFEFIEQIDFIHGRWIEMSHFKIDIHLFFVFWLFLLVKNYLLQTLDNSSYLSFNF